MPNLTHPRTGIMNHQPPGPTCFMACVVAIAEYYSKSLLPQRNGLSPVQWMYNDFMKYHAVGTSPAGYTKAALQHVGQYYDGDMRLGLATDAMQVYRNMITLKISNQKPVLCGVTRPGATYGHLFMIYGYTLPNLVAVADPILGVANIPIQTIRSGYNGNPAYHWSTMIFTKASGG